MMRNAIAAILWISVFVLFTKAPLSLDGLSPRETRRAWLLLLAACGVSLAAFLVEAP